MQLSAYVEKDEVIEEVVSTMHNDEIIAFVLAIDLRVANFDFTVSLINALQKSLLEDTPRGEE